MPRPLHLEPHFSADELKARYRASGDPVESRRWHLLWLVHTETTLTDAAKAVGFHYDYARAVVRDYNRDGADGLRNRRKDQRPQPSRSLLNPEQLKDLEARLQSPPDDDGVWSGPKVARVIAEVTGVAKVWPQRGWDYLKRLEQSLQVPRPRHRKGDPEAQEAFKKKLPERKAELEQHYPEALVEAWSFDEHRLGLKPIIRKVWAKVGQRPLALVDPRYEWTYLYGFVHPTTGDTEWLILPRVNSDWFNQALATFAEQVGAGPHKRILLVIDGAGWHTCKDLVIPDGIHLEVLPPYSPELQPAERLWRLADEPLVNRCFNALNDLEDILEARCRTLLSMQSEIKALTNYHWWPA